VNGRLFRNNVSVSSFVTFGGFEIAAYNYYLPNLILFNYATAISA
jgi:hypothetical protein